jgi:hypothetical protein
MGNMFFEVTQRSRLAPTSTNTTTIAVYPKEGSGQLHLHHFNDVVGTRSVSTRA